LRRTRILLIDMPRMLRELIQTTIAAHPELEVVGALDDAPVLAEAIEDAQADVVIVGADVVEPEEVAEALGLRPAAKVLRLSADGRESSLWELRPYEEHLGDIAPEHLLAAIRGAQPV
jgi:DNA-binding NarL/FixJ family response regulator